VSLVIYLIDPDMEEDLDLVFKPDQFAEEELGDAEEGNKALISDTTIRKGRLIASVRCVEHGKTGLDQRMLLVFAFVFHPVESRVKQTDIELRFNKGVITMLQPQEIDDRESEVAISNKLVGHFDMSHPPVALGMSAARETEKKRGHIQSIRGSGIDTELAVWTLRENSDQKGGVHLNFIAAIILKAKGEVDVEVEVKAQPGASLKDLLGIRKIISQKSMKFDGMTNRGRRSESFDDN
jgi:hypothetical protein